MSIIFVDRSGLLTDGLREFAERRLLFALARFASKVQRVTVVISDVNGPRGGQDKHCRVTVKLRRRGEVVVSQSDAEIGKCLAHMAERVGRAVARTVSRTQRVDRRRLDTATFS